MAKLRLFYIFSLLIPFTGIAQEEDSLATRRMITPSIYIDYGKLLTLPSNFESKYEFGAEILIAEKFPVIVEFGNGQLTPKSAYANGTYTSSGNYFRVGAGIVTAIDAKNNIGLSFRYAVATFDEVGEYSIESESGKQDSYSQSINRKNLNATWYEAVIFSERKIIFRDKEGEEWNWNPLSFGFNFRMRVLATRDKFDPIDVYAIPGYGRSFDKVIPAMNLFLKVSF
ncbi:MAG: DUF6048 family protein [Ekhidna sp.]